MRGRTIRHSLGVALVQIALAVACRADFVIPMTTIGDVGNSADWTGLGAVNYAYQISTYEVTVAQYVEFLNAKAQSDPYGLYNPYMMGGMEGSIISQSGADGSYTYSAVAGAENEPVRYVSFFDGLRLCNWLANGQGNGDTETGSYDLSLGIWATRATNATWVLPNEDEWYKAAYYNASNSLYYNYPNGSDAVPQEPTDETTPREMNFGGTPYWGGNQYFTSIGETTGYSPYGVCDMGGNVQEWTETFSHGGGEYRITRGGMFVSPASSLATTYEAAYPPTGEDAGEGFRLVFIIPEPSTVLLCFTGLAALFLSWVKRRFR